MCVRVCVCVCECVYCVPVRAYLRDIRSTTTLFKVPELNEIITQLKQLHTSFVLSNCTVDNCQFIVLTLRCQVSEDQKELGLACAMKDPKEGVWFRMHVCVFVWCAFCVCACVCVCV